EQYLPVTFLVTSPHRQPFPMGFDRLAVLYRTRGPGTRIHAKVAGGRQQCPGRIPSELATSAGWLGIAVSVVGVLRRGAEADGLLVQVLQEPVTDTLLRHGRSEVVFVMYQAHGRGRGRHEQR